MRRRPQRGETLPLDMQPPFRGAAGRLSPYTSGNAPALSLSPRILRAAAGIRSLTLIVPYFYSSAYHFGGRWRISSAAELQRAPRSSPGHAAVSQDSGQAL